MSEKYSTAIIDEVAAIIAQRRTTMPQGSYVTTCFERGWPYIARKVIEEATEAAIAAREESDDRLASEVADLIFFALVLLCDRGVDPSLVWQELSQRRR